MTKDAQQPAAATGADAALGRVPLDALHRELGARMGAFAGFEMPIQYPGGLRQEHLHTREACALFDVSHMGQLIARPRDGRIETPQQEIEACLPVDFDGWHPGVQRYSLLLNERGGIEDDLMLVNRGDEVHIVVNAGNRDQDLRLLATRCPGLEFEWVEAALVALQGPQTEAVLAALDPRAASPRFMEAVTLELLGTPCFVTRSGYTGEDGFEISIPIAEAEDVVRKLLEDPRVAPAGLGARDTLRLEAGLPLHGNDIGPDVTPVEAQLSFAIPRSRRSDGPKVAGFPGAEVVLNQLAHGAERRLVGLASDEAVPIRARAPLVDGDNRPVGEVTSGTISPTLGHPIMLGFLPSRLVESQAPVWARVRDKRLAVKLQRLPFVPKRYKR
ncbi:MAG: glycine cleavage system aminomethyltransferase GcvT [Burkholderiaceae bacterium]|nr:glycine cleavage system aminomethyltransferase GcvT [Burkholderiaceae bacterium]